MRAILRLLESRRFRCLFAVIFGFACVLAPMVWRVSSAAAEPIPVETAATPKSQVAAGVALQAASLNLEALGVSKLKTEASLSGKGQTIALVDTGVDLRVLGGSEGVASDRVLDWIDLTDEGTPTYLGTYVADSGKIHVGEIALNVSGVGSRSGRYIVGLLPETISSRMGAYRRAYFVVADPESTGLYNTVVIDTNGDLSFADEVRLKEFRSVKSYAVLRVDDELSITIVVSRIDTKEGRPTFGYDLNGHGTGLAALAAGSGKFQGAAPDAQVVVIKALGSDGLGDWREIERGIEEAIGKKASVVLVGSARRQADSNSDWSRLQTRLFAMGSHLVLPVGNAGPGAGTITMTVDAESTLLVSGYLPRSSASLLLGQEMSSDIWYPMSSAGPGPNGGRGPRFCAPAVGAVPSFRGNGDPVYYLMEGTSVSAGYVAGAVAQLRQAFTSSSGSLTKPLGFVTSALGEGARTMSHVLPVEQGSGRLDVDEAWGILRSRPDHREMLLIGRWDDATSSDGIYVKGASPGAFPIWVDNYAPSARTATFTASESWLRPRSDRLYLEPVRQREAIVYGVGELSPGFYSALLLADDPLTVGFDASLAVSVAVPMQFTTLGTLSANIERERGTVAHREFIQIPCTAESVTIGLRAGAPGESYAIYNPDGILVRHGTLEDAVVTHIGLPKAGMWQICVYGLTWSSPGAQVRIEASLDGFFAVDLGATVEKQYYMARIQTGTATLRAAAEDAESEWRHRRSYTQDAGRSTQLLLPEVDSSVEALSVRFGTATGSVLRAYLMHLDKTSGRWIEVGRALTATSGLGELHLPNPTPGNYAVHVEAYGVLTSVYVELDINLLLSGGADALMPSVPKAMASGSTTLQIPLRTDPSTPSAIVILRQSDKKVMGVIERPVIVRDDIPLVQVLGNADIKTIRAWDRSDMRPKDALVTVGGVAYQLAGGQISAPVVGGSHPSVVTETGVKYFVVPVASGR